jgi:hypothetical protein
MPFWQPQVADAGQRRPVVVGRLDVDADEAGAGPGKRFDVAFRFIEHQVRVEKELDAGVPQRRHGAGPERQIGHEMAVHDIDVQPLQAELGDDGGAGRQVGMVAGQQGRSE